MNVVPPILGGLEYLCGSLSRSQIQMKVFERYFLFQVINVFLVTAIEGSVINSITGIVKAPGNAFKLLGNSLPHMAGFFTR
jgi:hypothetical protein